MSEVKISDLATAPGFVRRCYLRATDNLANCPMRIVSRSILPVESNRYDRVLAVLDKYEAEAKRYYESLGFRVVRLEHFASSVVGTRHEGNMPESVALGNELREVLPPKDFATYVQRPRGYRQQVSLDGVDPRNYPLAFYPPDFLVVARNGFWKFVEVKGPTDKLRIRQANWFVHLLPDRWPMEIYASLNDVFDETFLCLLDAPKAGSGFTERFDLEYSPKQ